MPEEKDFEARRKARGARIGMREGIRRTGLELSPEKRSEFGRFMRDISGPEGESYPLMRDPISAGMYYGRKRGLEEYELRKKRRGLDSLAK